MEKTGKSKVFKKADLEFHYSRSSGPGGQNVNKRETSVQVRINIDNLLLPAEDKERLKNFVPRSHIARDNEMVVECSEERFRERNKEKAIARLEELIRNTLKKARGKEKAEKHKEKARKPKKRGVKISLAEKRTRKFRQETTDDLLKKTEE